MSAAQDASPIRWPDVPAVFGWLSLDRRGAWRLKGEIVEHGGLKHYLDAHYACDEAGRWLVHNGPQRVYVALDYAPWVLRLHPDGSVRTHTGRDAGAIDGAWLDDEGNVLLQGAMGIGLLDDRDLAAFLAECTRPDGVPADDEDLAALMDGGAALRWRGLPLQATARAEVPARFGFIPDPEP